ncbi:hypothetical protein [Aromatoleum evansii]|uniref:hypothetical protein n=1 Tax=Aromatoleum evansii TaxID=59406 RepID=UPI00145F7C54|nr:hypothetical protein [Aromatoleum evansii]NMG32233.1 hypothetical protein [Aromatoleum evansii]
MAKNIRTLVATAAIPFALFAGAASAETTCAAPTVTFSRVSSCEALDAVNAAIQAANDTCQFMTGNAATNYGNLMTKLLTADSKLASNDQKPAERKVEGAELALLGIIEKTTEWSNILPPQKKKLTESAAYSINTATMGALTSCTLYVPTY